MTAVVRTRLGKAGVILAVAGIWFATAQSIATGVLPLGQPEKIWLPSGLALGIVTVTGTWAAFGVVLGAGAYWLMRGASIPAALLIALLDAAEAAAGAYILTRVARVRLELARVRDVIGLLATAAAVSAVNALGVALVMAITGVPQVQQVLEIAPSWWWAHCTAQVILVPSILVFAARGVRHLTSGARVELACLAVAVLFVGAGVFNAWLWPWFPITLRSSYLFPLLIWAGLRWDLRIGTLVNLAISTMAVASWVAGVSPFPSLPALHSFITICAVTTLVVAALRSERILGAVRQAALHEAALDAIITVGSDGKIVEINPAALSLFGLRAADAIGSEAASLLVPQPLREQVRDAIAHYSHDGGDGSSSRRICFPLLNANGDEFPAEVALCQVRLQGEVWFTAFVRDITAERIAEQARRESRELLEHKVHERTLELISANEELKRRDELLRQAQQLAKLGSFDFDVVTARFQWSDELVRILGRDPASLEPTYEGVLACVHAEDRSRVRSTLETVMKRPQAFGFEARVVRPDASQAVVLCRGRVAADSRGALVRVAGYCQDITERVRGEKARSRLIHLVESSSDAILALSLDGKIESWNPAATRIFGFTAAEIVGKSATMLVSPPSGPELTRRLDSVRCGSTLAHYEMRHRRKDGAEFDASVALSPICDDQGQLLGVSEVVRDVSEQKAAEHRLWASLREKEILLREIHHRVKNNLQVISSLLNLQMQRLGTVDARQALLESASRIRSMALVHQMLYRSKDLGHINFLEYLQTVVDSLVAMHGGEAARIDHAVMGDAVNLDVDRAIVCGLIVTELVTNSLRHAFPNGSAGHLMVAARRTGSDVSLEVRDDGIGLPESASAGQVASFGLQIARALTEQLEGAIDIDVDHGTCITIRFPLAARDETHPVVSEPAVASQAS